MAKTTYYSRVDRAQLDVSAARKELKNLAATLRNPDNPDDIEACAIARAELTIAYEALGRARIAVASVLPEPLGDEDDD